MSKAARGQRCAKLEQISPWTSGKYLRNWSRFFIIPEEEPAPISSRHGVGKKAARQDTFNPPTDWHRWSFKRWKTPEKRFRSCVGSWATFLQTSRFKTVENFVSDLWNWGGPLERSELGAESDRRVTTTSRPVCTPRRPAGCSGITTRNGAFELRSTAVPRKGKPCQMHCSLRSFRLRIVPCCGVVRLC